MKIKIETMFAFVVCVMVGFFLPHPKSEVPKQNPLPFGSESAHAESGAWFSGLGELYLQDTNTAQWYWLVQSESNANSYTVWKLR